MKSTMVVKITEDVQKITENLGNLLLLAGKISEGVGVILRNLVSNSTMVIVIIDNVSVRSTKVDENGESVGIKLLEL